MIRFAPQQTKGYQIPVQTHVQILSSFMPGGVPQCMQGMLWDIPHVGNSNKLQYHNPFFTANAWEN